MADRCNGADRDQVALDRAVQPRPFLVGRPAVFVWSTATTAGLRCCKCNRSPKRYTEQLHIEHNFSVLSEVIPPFPNARFSTFLYPFAAFVLFSGQCNSILGQIIRDCRFRASGPQGTKHAMPTESSMAEPGRFKLLRISGPTDVTLAHGTANLIGCAYLPSVLQTAGL